MQKSVVNQLMQGNLNCNQKFHIKQALGPEDVTSVSTESKKARLIFYYSQAQEKEKLNNIDLINGCRKEFYKIQHAFVIKIFE